MTDCHESSIRLRSRSILLIAAVFIGTFTTSQTLRAQEYDNPRMPSMIGVGASNTHGGLGVLIGASLLDSRFGIIAGLGVLAFPNRSPRNPLNASVALQYRITHTTYVQLGYAPIGMEGFYFQGEHIESSILNGPTLIGGWDWITSDDKKFGISLGLGVGAVFRSELDNIVAPVSTVGVFWVL